MRSLTILVTFVAIGLCQACAMDTEQGAQGAAGAPRDVWNECATQPLLSDPYVQCSEILAGRLVQRYENDRDPATAGNLLAWLCDSPGAAARADSLQIDGQRLSAWQTHCPQRAFPYPSASFTFHALGEITDLEVLGAWRDCMAGAGHGLVCAPRPSDANVGDVHFAYSWHSVDSWPELTLDWTTLQNVSPVTSPLPSTVQEGDEGEDYAEFRITNPDELAVIVLRGRGGRGNSGFMVTCDAELLPPPAAFEPPIISDQARMSADQADMIRDQANMIVDQSDMTRPAPCDDFVGTTL